VPGVIGIAKPGTGLANLWNFHRKLKDRQPIVLNTFEEATTVLSAENYVIISLVHPVINALQRYLSAYITNSLTVSMVAKDIAVDIATRFSYSFTTNPDGSDKAALSEYLKKSNGVDEIQRYKNLQENNEKEDVLVEV